MFSNDKVYYCYYENVEGLQNSANVQINGLNVGHVTRMELAAGRGVKVTLSIKEDVNIPEGSIATISSELLGANYIKLDAGPGPAAIPEKGEIRTDNPGGIVQNVTQDLKHTIGKIDTTLGSVNTIVGGQNQQQIAEALESINRSAKNIEGLTSTLNKESQEITAILHNAREITGNLARQSDTIRAVITNANKLMRNLSNAPIDQTVTELRGTIGKLNDVIGRINRSEGSLGLLINDKALHTNLNRSLKSLDSLMTDIKAHPGRYINVTVFGSGKKKD